MTVAQIAAVVFSGLLIGLALYLLVRTLERMLKGRCCEGCEGCPQSGNCADTEKE